jgi:hypothetical protein
MKISAAFALLAVAPWPVLAADAPPAAAPQPMQISIPLERAVETSAGQPASFTDIVKAETALVAIAADYCRTMSATGLVCVTPKMMIDTVAAGPDGRLKVHGHLEASVGDAPRSPEAASNPKAAKASGH